jgi:Vta1 C-terminal domain
MPKAGSIKKDGNYFKVIGDAKKNAQNAVSELDYSNVNNAIKYLKIALEVL